MRENAILFVPPPPLLLHPCTVRLRSNLLQLATRGTEGSVLVQVKVPKTGNEGEPVMILTKVGPQQNAM
jgi:hypothetical protein